MKKHAHGDNKVYFYNIHLNKIRTKYNHFISEGANRETMDIFFSFVQL